MKKGHKFESLPIAIMLSIVGGFVDAFSYLHLGHVFSALQTGNIVLLGLNIATFNVGAILHYLLPIFSFLVASAIANFVELSGPKLNRFVWQEIVIYIELIGLFITRLLISQLDTTIIVSMLSFFMAFQVHSFRVVNNHPYASAMNTGNLKKVGNSAIAYLLGENKSENKTIFVDCLLIILTFVLGAILSSWLSIWIGINAIFFPMIVLIAVLILVRCE
ncbi:YoaK family protein [Holzapfeliella floricola]|uniref:DUF1275 domain-containing protein n=2 Tax=Holzapfeliella TaxID=2767883 RepID=A0A0R2DL19_9LACO|nr:YoaK family protein [Holzapfeliella floricola]KRN04881.1 hypothetical protein FC86_GL001240 [Holzapfeliella floricola DSM 23037 = JCM 16512]